MTNLRKDLSLSTIAGKRRRSRGVGIVTAIFLLVVLAGLGVAMVSLFNAQQQGILLDEQGVRAQQAARAGIEWGLFQRLRPGQTGCADKSTTAVGLGGDVLSKFTVNVSCTRFDGPKGAETELERWKISATACAPAINGACPASSGNPEYVRRVIEVQI